LVASGIKPIEKPPPIDHPPRRRRERDSRFHASREIDEQAYDRIEEIAPELQFAGPTIMTSINAKPHARRPRHRGQPLGADQIRWFFGTRRVRPPRWSGCCKSPVPCRGALGFWDAAGRQSKSRVWSPRVPVADPRVGLLVTSRHRPTTSACDSRSTSLMNRSTLCYAVST